jgi:chromosome segregation ATPase
MTRECTVHHHACDCREDRFAEIEGERDELKLDVERLEGMLDELDRENTVLQGRLKKAEGPCNAEEAAVRMVEHTRVMLDDLRVERDALKVELHELKAKVSQWAVNHAWMLEEVEPKEDMDKINRVISPPEGISISEWCKRTHIQLCHCCDDLTCDDNLRKELTEKENESKR